MDSAMTPVRKMVEHSFSKCVSLWPFMDYNKKHRMWASPTVDEWIVVALATNLHTSCYASKMNAFMGIPPPSIFEYLNNCHLNLLM